MFKRILSIIILITFLNLFSMVCYGQITDYETPEMTADEIVDRILEIAVIDKEDRTVEEWDELTKLLAYLLILENEELGEYIQIMNEKIIELESELELYRSYNLEFENKIIKLNNTKDQFNELIEITNQYIEKLLYQIELYQDKIKELESYKNSVVIDIGIIHYGALNIELNYFREIDFFVIGCGINFTYNYNDKLKELNKFGIGFNLSIGLSF